MVLLFIVVTDKLYFTSNEVLMLVREFINTALEYNTTIKLTNWY